MKLKKLVFFLQNEKEEKKATNQRGQRRRYLFARVVANAGGPIETSEKEKGGKVVQPSDAKCR